MKLLEANNWLEILNIIDSLTGHSVKVHSPKTRIRLSTRTKLLLINGVPNNSG